MKINIYATIDGQEIITDFVQKIKNNNVEVSWEKDTLLPNGMKILVTNKENKEVEISPDRLKIVFNQ